jgi:hypothetical protein
MKKKELFVVMLQLKELNHNGTFHIMNHINESLMQGERVIEAALPHLSVTVLQQIRSELESTNDVVRRCQCLAKFFFEQETADITSTISAMRLGEEALKLITIVKIWEITWTGAAGCRGMISQTKSMRSYSRSNPRIPVIWIQILPICGSNPANLCSSLGFKSHHLCSSLEFKSRQSGIQIPPICARVWDSNPAICARVWNSNPGNMGFKSRQSGARARDPNPANSGFKSRQSGIQIPPIWDSNPGSLGLAFSFYLNTKSRQSGIQIPAFWDSNPGILGFKSRHSGIQIPAFWDLNHGMQYP